MYSYEYPHPALTTDCVVFGFDGSGLNLLLVERGLKPYKGKWALPGGFVRIDETLEEGALRELREETGVMDIYIEQLQAFSRVDRDPRERVVTVAFLAFVRQEGYEVIAGDDAAKHSGFRWICCLIWHLTIARLYVWHSTNCGGKSPMSRWHSVCSTKSLR